jgi:Mrp family chromosome partitioning ATPase
LVLVVQANATRRDAARKAKESLQAANVRLLGAVLDNRTFPIPDAIYQRI